MTHPQCQQLYDLSLRLINFLQEEPSTFSAWGDSLTSLRLTSRDQRLWFKDSGQQTSPQCPRSPPGVLCTQLCSPCSPHVCCHHNCQKHFPLTSKHSRTISWKTTGLGDGIEGRSEGHTGPVFRKGAFRQCGTKAVSWGRLEGFWPPRRGMRQDLRAEVWWPPWVAGEKRRTLERG